MSTPPPAAPTTDGPLAAAAHGWRTVRGAPPLHLVWLAALLLLTLLMLPFGRTGADDAGGLLAPLTADSGNRALFRLVPGADFYSVYDAGSRLLAGRDPYGVNLDTGGPGHRAPYVLTFRYLPIAAFWLAIPLNVLPPAPAYALWVVLCLAMLAANFLLCVGRRPDLLPLHALIWFAWFPVIAELHMGQFTLFMATLMLWGFDGLMAGRHWGGLGWALASLLKVYPIAMAPLLWRWGWRRWAAGTVAVAVLSTIAWQVIVPRSDMGEGLGRRGIAGRIVAQSRQPYAGAQGVQAAVNAITWKTAGHSMNHHLHAPSPPLRDPTFLLNATMLGAFGLLCLLALLRSGAAAPRPECIGLFWLIWFYAYVDCWEHHYVLIQALLGFLLCQRIISPRLAILCWLAAGAPSLWWLWQRTGYAGNPLAETIGLAYFLQRPIAVLALTGALGSKLWTQQTNKNPK